MEILGKRHLDKREVVIYVLYINFTSNFKNNTAYLKTYHNQNVRASTGNKKIPNKELKHNEE